MEPILIACGKQEKKKTSEALSLSTSPFLLNITPVRKLWIPHDVTSAILVSQTIKRWPYWCPKPVLWHVNERVGVVVRTLASHQCCPGSDPGVDIICGLSLLFVLTQKKQHFQIPIRSGTHEHNSTSSQELLSATWVNSKLQLKRNFFYAFFCTNMF